MSVEIFDLELEEKVENITFDFMEKISKIREYLETDIQATYDSAPADKSKDEVIFSYWESMQLLYIGLLMNCFYYKFL